MDYSITAYLGPRAIFEGLRKDTNSKLGYKDKTNNTDTHIRNPACITVGVNQIGSTTTGYPKYKGFSSKMVILTLQMLHLSAVYFYPIFGIKRTQFA